MRRPTALQVTGAALVLGTVGSMMLPGVPGPELVDGDLGSAELGTTGCVAAVIGWSALAASAVRAMSRAAAATIGAFVAFGAALALLFVIGRPVDPALPWWVPSFEVYANVEGDEFALPIWVDTTRLTAIILGVVAGAVVGTVAAVPAAAAALAASVGTRARSAPARRALWGLASSPVLAETAMAVSTRHWPAAVAGGLALVWLAKVLTLAARSEPHRPVDASSATVAV